MFTRIKDAYGNFRRHKILFALLVILSALCYRMFTQNYEIVQPIINKRSETYTQVWNDRVILQAQVDELKAARALSNADIMQ